MTTSISTYSRENGGRVLLLFLLFLLAIYQFITAGFSAFAIVCLIPFLVFGAIAVFKWRMSAFWLLIFINYFVQWKEVPPTGLPVNFPSAAFTELNDADKTIRATAKTMANTDLNLFI